MTSLALEIEISYASYNIIPLLLNSDFFHDRCIDNEFEIKQRVANEARSN